MSQSIDIRFSGRMNNVGYVRADSVEITNITSYWSETLVYPDTVLTLSVLGINDVKNGLLGMEAYPNPLRGQATAAVQLAESGPVSVAIYDLSGRRVANYSGNMDAGSHLFKIKLQKRQMYVLSVTSKQGQRSTKLFNAQEGGENSVCLDGKDHSFEKLVSANPFHRGDVLRIKGYTMCGGTMLESVTMELPIDASCDIRLPFTHYPDGCYPAGSLYLQPNRCVSPKAICSGAPMAPML